MALELYNRKRHFDETPEPEGKVKKSKGRLSFVIQRHEASSLHYDFRLEAEGVLKSWAVPKGPSLNPADKRLAVQVEDHPVSYGSFTGDIPEGNYGAGHVEIWDNGSYEPIDEKGNTISEAQLLEGLEKGSIRIRIFGQQLQGNFSLRRMQGRGDKNWLLIKHRDEFATDEDFDIEALPPVSLRSKKKTAAPKKKTASKKKAAAAAPAKPKKAATKKKAPSKPAASPDEAVSNKFTDYIVPMMARLHEGAFNDAGWVFEIKWDGYRAIAEIAGNDTRLYSRNGLSFEDKYPVIFQSLKKIRKKLVLDGEIVAFNEKGLPDFQLLQQYGTNDKVELAYYVFDILYVNGKSVQDKPLLERKALLKDLLPETDLIRYCDHVPEKGKDFFKVMQQKGLEGMIAKRADSVYQEGVRTEDWLKVKQVQTEEAIICGYTEPKGARKFFGAILLGMYEQGKLKYIGHSGTGFNAKSLKQLYELFQKYVSPDSPFSEKVPGNMPVTWLRPELVCNIKFTEITQGGIRRHPVYLGLRVDKEAGEVSEEAQQISVGNKHDNMEKAKTTGRRKVNFTHLDKIYFPEDGITKGDVINYYDKVSKWMLKYLKDRPQSLRRNPNGIKDEGFFHKDVGDEVPDWIDKYPIWSESANREINYIVCNDRSTLLYMANMGCIEINPWNSRTAYPGHPDYLVLDLDPSEENTFDQVIETAQVIREILEKAKCPCYCKTSGATGLHVYVPLGAQFDYDQARMFAEMVAVSAQEQLSDITSIERSLRKRGTDKIYIDYMQNKTGQTLSSVYSVRPKPGATVSTPLDWKEVKPGLKPTDFHIKNILQRIEKKGDLFAPILKKGINMDRILKNFGS